MQTIRAIVTALTLATIVAGDEGATRTLRGAMADNSELDQLEGSGSNNSILWVNASKPEERRPIRPNYHHGHQQLVCQINFPKNCWYVDIFDQ
ncbi:hypothetical protein DVH05_011228 [Phytophthora capsici]|nr:hypothetical protein DVH05_011228 [Phytophthora capsici]